MGLFFAALHDVPKKTVPAACLLLMTFFSLRAPVAVAIDIISVVCQSMSSIPSN